MAPPLVRCLVALEARACPDQGVRVLWVQDDLR
jgi:hypothetical protein